MQEQLILKTYYYKGASKEEAFKECPIRVIRDATRSWIKAGAPIVNSMAFKRFCYEYVHTHRMESIPGLGCCITVGHPKGNTRRRPYKVYDVSRPLKTHRKYMRVYQVYEAEVSVGGNKPALSSLGKLHSEYEKKPEAVRAMKSLITKNRRDYIIVKAKKCTNEDALLAYGKYTPSSSTQIGQYAVFGMDIASNVNNL
jgi:hypothetical protein